MARLVAGCAHVEVKVWSSQRNEQMYMPDRVLMGSKATRCVRCWRLPALHVISLPWRWSLRKQSWIDTELAASPPKQLYLLVKTKFWTSTKSYIVCCYTRAAELSGSNCWNETITYRCSRVYIIYACLVCAEDTDLTHTCTPEIPWEYQVKHDKSFFRTDGDVTLVTIRLRRHFFLFFVLSTITL